MCQVPASRKLAKLVASIYARPSSERCDEAKQILKTARRQWFPQVTETRQRIAEVRKVVVGPCIGDDKVCGGVSRGRDGCRRGLRRLLRNVWAVSPSSSQPPASVTFPPPQHPAENASRQPGPPEARPHLSRDCSTKKDAARSCRRTRS